MLLNSYNNHLYNINKFNKYNNIYVIKINKNNNTHKIIYGHFYNNHNEFLYKKIINNKIVDIEILRCKSNELLYNNVNDLIYSKSLNILNNYLKKLIRH